MLRSISNRNFERSFVAVSEAVNCECRSFQTGKIFNFCYINPQNSSFIGRKFDCEHLEILEDAGLLETNFIFSNLSEIPRNESEFVFVSSTSNDQFDFTLSSIKCIREFYPDQKYILYGLNLNSSLVNQLPNDPNFEFRQYYNPVPKPVIMARALKETGAFWWIEPEIALRKPDVIKKFLEKISSQASSIVSFRSTHQFIAGGLHPEILNFYPGSSLEALKNTNQVEVSVLFVTRTQQTVNILKWWTLCSLTKSCIQARSVDPEEKPQSPARPRYDLAVFNLLMLNEFQNRENYFMSDFESSFVTMKDL
uniref:Uncharacterized protein n=1 Tax=Caenorhabditis tropicalis TaxID=1561998 RepID=A0A1I7V478_9PELO